MQKIRLQKSDDLAQLDAGMNDLGLGSDGGANAINDTQDTAPADDPSVSVPPPTASQASRKATTTVVSLTLAGASVITANFERNVRQPDLPTGSIVDAGNESRPTEDSTSSTTITLGSGRTGKTVTVSVEFSGDAFDGDDQTEGLSNEKGLVVTV